MTFTRGSGNGGQHRNTSDTAVRVVHRPSGLVAYREDSRSQDTNRQHALQDLQRRLTAARADTTAAAVQDVRRRQTVPDRAAKGFTWNEQRGTVVDHDRGRTWRIRDVDRGRLA